MKKILVVLTVLGLVFALAGCGKTNETSVLYTNENTEVEMNEVWDSLDEETKYFAEHSTFVTYEGEDYQIVSDNFDDSDEPDVLLFHMLFFFFLFIPCSPLSTHYPHATLFRSSSFFAKKTCAFMKEYY